MLQRRRLISILICVVMILTMLPASQQVFAATSTAQAQSLYNSVKAEYEGVVYEDFFGMLNPPVKSIERLNVQTQLKKEFGREPTDAEVTSRLAQMYLDRLDMRESFEEVKAELDTIMPKVLETAWITTKSKDYAVTQLKNNKNQVLFALTYLDRYYSFEVGGVAAKDIILYHPEIVGTPPDPDAFTTLTGLGSMTYNEAKGTATATVYTNRLSWITEIDQITDFLQAMLEGTGAGVSAEEYLRQSNAVIEERGETSLFAKMQDDARLKSYLLPLLSLSSKSVYVVSTDYTTTLGLTSTYGGAESEEFKDNITKTAANQQSFLDFWKRISQKADSLDAGNDVVLIDTMAVKGDGSTSQLWSAEYGNAADPGVREFMTPAGHYRIYMQSSAEAEINSLTVQFFMSRALTDGGVNTYTHELTHIYDETVWLNGRGLRNGVGGETFARGLFEAENNTQGQSAYAPYFNLNTAYALGDSRIQNQSPERFVDAEDLGEYMHGVMDVIYTLDVIEAQEILKLSDADKAILFNKVSLVEDASKPGRKLDKFEHITEEEAKQLNTLDDLVDKNIVSGRLVPKGSETVQTIAYNDYVVVPMFEGIYAGVQNDVGNVGDFLFRRYAHELLGEYGWEEGMVAYVSNQYENDGAALNAILDEAYGGSLAAFKKDMFKRRVDKLDTLAATATYKDAEVMRQAISEALQKDLASMKDGIANGPSYYMQWVTAVQNVKADIFKEYLLQTEDFRESIYESQKEEPGTGGNTGETPDPMPTPDPEPTPTPKPDPDPTDPTEPTDPMRPGNPSGSTDPTEPTEPTEPTRPGNPSGSTVPTEPTDPTDPTRPSNPTTPTLPSGTVNGPTVPDDTNNLEEGDADIEEEDDAEVTAQVKVTNVKIKKAKKAKIKISWKNVEDADGYQIARSTKKNKGYKVIKTVKSTKGKFTNIKAKRKKNYYYKIRAYKTVGGKKIYGTWSSAKKYMLR